MGSRFRSGRPGSPHHAARLPRSVVLGMPAWTVVLGALALASAGIARTTHRAPASQAQARITIASPVPTDLSARVEAALQVCLHGPLRRQQLPRHAWRPRNQTAQRRVRKPVRPGEDPGATRCTSPPETATGGSTTTTSQFLVERAITWSGYSRALDLRAFTL